MSVGYSYTIEDDKIREYMSLSTEDRLKWLQEINEFTNLVLTAKDREIRKKLRNDPVV